MEFFFFTSPFLGPNNFLGTFTSKTLKVLPCNEEPCFTLIYNFRRNRRFGNVIAFETARFMALPNKNRIKPTADDVPYRKWTVNRPVSLDTP
jgi:hypothetical protein